MDRAQLRKDEKEVGNCQLFTENLYVAALKWFSKLEEQFIDSFKHLSAAFLKYSFLWKMSPLRQTF